VTGQGKCIIFSAPSGAGKTTIVQHLLKTFPELAFSISACSRDKRPGEVDGKDYHFIGVEGFRKMIDQQAFVEWEEVYKNHYYGTLKSEITRIWEQGQHVIFDVDVVGGLNLKRQFGNLALAVFVMPPSIEILEERLRARKTEPEERILQRIGKATKEMSTAGQFDYILHNNQLDTAFREAEEVVARFLKEEPQ
jgi:guanylate kinase